MARIFSISFLHNGLERTAMIAVRPTPFATEYTITMAHEDLLEVLPSQKILSTERGSFAFVNPASKAPTALMTAILQALADHVETSV
jgi:hypothetical protein